MNFLIVLVSFGALSLVGAYNASETPTNSSERLRLKEEYERGIEDLLTPYCQQARRCTIMTYFVASICSVPSHSHICQSDCEFLLQKMWDHVLLGQKPSIPQLEAYVPDGCVPEADRTVSNEEEGRSQLHLASEPSHDDRVVSESVSACRERGLNGNNHTLLGGDLWVDNCPTSVGEVWGVCLEHGHLFKSYRLCH